MPTKHLSLVEPNLKSAVRNEDGWLRIEISAESLACFLERTFDGVDVVFSDNYFDLPAGRSVTVSTPVPPGWSIDRARAALRLRSLFDSY